MDPIQNQADLMTRRYFFGRAAAGIGTAALASLLNDRLRAAPTSGNRAFDEYRSETLRRLEDEQKEFSSFLERLRFAKDKAEFDQFMADRRQAPRPPVVPDEPSHG